MFIFRNLIHSCFAFYFAFYLGIYFFVKYNDVELVSIFIQKNWLQFKRFFSLIFERFPSSTQFGSFATTK